MVLPAGGAGNTSSGRSINATTSHGYELSTKCSTLLGRFYIYGLGDSVQRVRVEVNCWKGAACSCELSTPSSLSPFSISLCECCVFRAMNAMKRNFCWISDTFFIFYLLILCHSSCIVATIGFLRVLFCVERNYVGLRAKCLRLGFSKDDA